MSRLNSPVSNGSSVAALATALLARQQEIIRGAASRINREYVQFLAEQAERGTPPAWPRMDPGELDRLVGELVPRALKGIRDGGPPAPEDLALAANVGAERARHGEPVDQMLESYRLGARELLSAIERVAAEHEVPTSAALRMSSQLWDWVDQLLASAAAAHREVELAMARHDQELRLAYLRGVLLGSLTATRMQAGITYGLRPDRRYRAIRARAQSGYPIDALERMVHGAIWKPGIVGILEGDLVGVLPHLPPSTPFPVGVGPPATLNNMANSFALASRALETAVLTNRTGPVGIEELSLLPAVVAEQELGETVISRRVTPLEQAGRFGEEILHTVEQYLESRQSVDAAASQLFIHPNTLRHRLSRYQELTGTDLRRADHLAEVWWALQKRRLDRRY